MDSPTHKTLVYHNISDDTYSMYSYDFDLEKWVPVEDSTIKVTFDPRSSAGSISAYAVVEGSSVTFPAVFMKGYDLVGWSYQATGGSIIYGADTSSAVFHESVTLYAQWALSENTLYVLTYDVDGGSAPAPAPEVRGASFTTFLAAYGGTKEGHAFGGWNDGTSLHAPGSSYTVDAPQATLRAVWIPVVQDQRAVFVSGDHATLRLNGSAADFSQGYIIMDSSDTLTIVPNTGYTFFVIGLIEIGDGEYKLDPDASVFGVHIREELAFVEPPFFEATLYVVSGTTHVELTGYAAFNSIVYASDVGVEVSVDIADGGLEIGLPAGVLGTVPLVLTLSDGDSDLYCTFMLVVLPGMDFILPPI